MTCPGHGATYDLTTGEVLSWEPKCVPLQNARVEGDDVEVEI